MNIFAIAGSVVVNGGLKLTSNGLEMVKLTIQSQDDQFEVTFFGKTSQDAATYYIGDLVAITGHLKISRGMGKTGNSFTRLDMRGSKIERLSATFPSPSVDNSYKQGKQIPLDDDSSNEIPF